MSRVAELLRSRRVPQVAVLALMSVGFAGCSADMQTRLSDSLLQSLCLAARSDRLGARARRRTPRAAAICPAAGVLRAAIPVPGLAAARRRRAARLSGRSGGVSGGGRGISSYAPPSRSPIETTATVPPRSVAAARPAAQNGTTIIVGTSDTLDILAKRYNVSSAAILQANGYKGPRVLSPGQQLIIPKQAAVAAAAPALAPRGQQAGCRCRGAVERPYRQSRRYADEHRAPEQCPGWRTRQGQQSRSIRQAQPRHEAHRARFEIRGRCASRRSPSSPQQLPSRLPPVAAPATKMAAAGGPPQARGWPQATTNVAEEKPVVEAASVKPSEATGALPTFRWPVRGKVITSYGAKTNGKSNDGINLAVPEGTPVKAAEDGVVAYSGNELKGYGNLVLVRHSNGYVTAYAHASELMVKRGDTIKRGQIIAKSGQSGEVGSPQLHFEIRKGSSPVDPLQFLNGA